MVEPKHIDEPASPTSVQVNDAPRSYHVQHFAIGLENPIDVEATKEFFSNSIMLKLPRFTSLLVKHNNNNHNRQSWKRTRVDIDEHFTIVRHNPNLNHNLNEEEAEDAVNTYLAELAGAPPMSTDKPLWEIHVLVDLRCLVLRVHHAIGDGASLASLIREIGTEKKISTITNDGKEKKARAENWRSDRGILGFFKFIWFSTIFLVHFLLSFSLVRDKKSVLNAKNYVHNWPQKLATVRFKMEEVKLVKKAIPNATINDILCGIIWGGFVKYINAQSSMELKEGQQITGVLMANMRAQSGFQDLSTLMKDGNLESYWGNKFSFFMLPAYYTTKVTNTLDYVRKAKFMLDRKKQSMEPLLMFKLKNLLFHVFGVKVLYHMIARCSSNVTFGFSNVVGPLEQISIANNRVRFLRLSLSTSPMRILMHLLSYANNLDLQILVVEEVIPDPKFLAKCFRDTLQAMKDLINQLGKTS